MKSKYWAVLLGLILAICVGLSILFAADRAPSSHAQILSGGKILFHVDLSIDQEFTITGTNGFNIVTVRDGKIAVTEADCPDGYCMDRGFCNSGAQIVCLPNGMVIRFTDDGGIDGVLG